MVRHVLKINSQNQNVINDLEIFKQNKNKGLWFVKYYADWCPHCTNMQSEWNSLENHEILTSKNIHIAEIEESYLNKLNFNPNVVGYPTIKLYNNGNHENFQGQRSQDGMSAFLSSKQSGGRKVKTKKNTKRNQKKNTRRNQKKNTRRNQKKNTKRNKQN